jgi:hypothetical protein
LNVCTEDFVCGTMICLNQPLSSMAGSLGHCSHGR